MIKSCQVINYSNSYFTGIPKQNSKILHRVFQNTYYNITFHVENAKKEQIMFYMRRTIRDTACVSCAEN